MKIVTPSPLKDEIFSSWLYRLSLSKLPGAAFAWQNWQVVKCQYPIDIDYGLAPSDVLEISDIFGIPVFSLAQMTMAASWRVLPKKNRIFFCPECIESDIARSELPAWRRSWNNFHNVVCIEHMVMLNHLPSLSRGPDSDKAWRAFQQLCVDKQPYPKIRSRNAVELYGDNLFSSGAWELLWNAAVDFQVWFQRAMSGDEVLGAGYFAKLTFQQLESFVNDMASILLRSHYRGMDSRCLVSRILRDPASYHEGFPIGVSVETLIAKSNDVSYMRMRVIALVLLGCILGLFDARHIAAIENSLSCLGFYSDLSPRILKKHLAEFTHGRFDLWLLQQSRTWDTSVCKVWEEDWR